MDKDESFFRELLEHHVSGQLKVAPEHCAARVLDQNGRVYDESNIDALLSMRHLAAKARRAGA